MQYADFTKVARYYRHKFHYCAFVLDSLSLIASAKGLPICVADIGAGTGELTVELANRGFSGFAVEPNEAMLREGKERLTDGRSFVWSQGSAESTMLPSASVDWVIFGGSFHWTNNSAALAEARRILKPSGMLTAIWVMRDLVNDPFQAKVDGLIEDMIPNVHRVYHGIERLHKKMPWRLLEGGLFGDALELGGWHTEPTSSQQYLSLWRMVHDVQSQVSAERFDEILGRIETLLPSDEILSLHYHTRAWTVCAL